jgi:hypothetical protein
MIFSIAVLSSIAASMVSAQQLPSAAGQTNLTLQVQGGPYSNQYLNGFHTGAGMSNLAPSGSTGSSGGQFYVDSTTGMLMFEMGTFSVPCFVSPTTGGNAGVVQCGVTFEQGSDLTSFSVSNGVLSFGSIPNSFYICQVLSSYGNNSAVVAQYASGATHSGMGISQCAPLGGQIAVKPFGPVSSAPISSVPVSTATTVTTKSQSTIKTTITTSPQVTTGSASKTTITSIPVTSITATVIPTTASTAFVKPTQPVFVGAASHSAVGLVSILACVASVFLVL